MLKIQTNEVTGAKEFNFNAKLVSVSTSVRELKNENKTKYRLVTMSTTLPNGAQKVITAQVWEKNVPNVTIGETYTVTATVMADGNLLFTCNSITNGETLSLTDFGITSVQASTPANARVTS